MAQPDLPHFPVTVAVVSWNTCELLDACLRSLEPEHLAGRADVVVVDNGSTDGSRDLVRSTHRWVRLVERLDNPGFGTAANVALQDSRAPFVAVANADVALHPGALAALTDAARAHPSAGVLAPRLRMPDGATQHSVHPFPSARQVVAVDLGLGRLLPGARRRLALEGAWDPDAGREVDWAHGAFLLVRREAWESVGGFDRSMWMYAEDLDLCWRIRRAGWTTRYVPEAVVDHQVSAATSQVWGDGRLARSQQAAYAWSVQALGPTQARLLSVTAELAGRLRVVALAAGSRVRPVRYGWRHERARTLLDARRAARREAP